MNIALLAHEKKKELMIQFCTAYAGILSKHTLSSGSALANIISENTGLEVTATNSDRTGILRLCDVHNVPLATNIATAQVIVMALDRGDLDWIDITKRK